MRELPKPYEEKSLLRYSFVPEKDTSKIASQTAKARDFSPLHFERTSAMLLEKNENLLRKAFNLAPMKSGIDTIKKPESKPPAPKLNSSQMPHESPFSMRGLYVISNSFDIKNYMVSFGKC